MMPTIEKLSAVTLRVMNMTQSVRFYRDVLGSLSDLLCHASTCFRIGSKFRCIRSTPTEMQSMSENDFECLASTGVKSPLNAMFEHTKTRYPQVIANRMLLSWEFLRPMEKRHPSI